MKSLAERSGCHYMTFVLHSTVTETWKARVATSDDKVDDAALQLFKDTPGMLALRMQAYLNTGLAGKHCFKLSQYHILTLCHGMGNIDDRSS